MPSEQADRNAAGSHPAHVKSFLQFLKTTVLGGVLVLLPAVLVAAFVGKAVVAIRAIAAPLVDQLPEGLRFPTLIAALVILAISFAAGLLVRTGLGRRAGRVIETHFLERIPGYTIVRSVTRQVAGVKEEATFAAALAVIEDALVPAFVVEQHADGLCTVFVPAAPTPGVGAIYILPANRVHLLDVPFTQAVKCISKWGVGSHDLLLAMRKGAGAPTVPNPKPETT